MPTLDGHARELADALEQLSRHELRRARGIPTVSVLVGETERAVSLWRRWGQPCATIRAESTELRTLAAEWIAGLTRQRDLRKDAIAILASRIGQTRAALCSRLSSQGPLERALWLNEHLSSEGSCDLDVVCRMLLDSDGPGFQSVLGRRDAPLERLVGVLSQMVPGPALPTLVLANVHRTTPSEWMTSAADTLERLVDAAPQLRAAVVCTPAEFSAWLSEPAEFRAKALLRQTVIAVPTEDESQPFQPDSRSLLQPTPTQPVDQARSAAERFLFEMLESYPGTAGLFELNGRLDFSFGGAQPMEIDLGSRELRLAVEIDGYYHFLDAEAYRRDRRKDMELQQRGWLVLRFLADDVVARQEEILHTVAEAVRQRRQQPGGYAD